MYQNCTISAVPKTAGEKKTPGTHDARRPRLVELEVRLVRGRAVPRRDPGQRSLEEGNSHRLLVSTH